MMRAGSRGLVLAELLVSASLLALVAGTAAAALGAGVRVWRRAASLGSEEQAVLLGFSRLRTDLLNARRFAPVPFRGRSDTLQFAAVHPTADGEEPVEELGRLGYFFDARRQLLCRSFASYRELRSVRLRERCQPLLEDVNRVRVRYFGIDPDRGEGRWTSHWELDTLPLAVRLSAWLGRAGRDTEHTVLVSLTGSPIPDAEEDHDEPR
jgi:hypothetical protein